MERDIEPDFPGPLAAILFHAATHSPYYRGQEWASRLRAGHKIDFRDVPITSKLLVKTQTDRFFSSFVSSGDGIVHTKHTSGSTGEPMAVRKTQRHFQVNAKENQRLQGGWEVARLRRIAHIEFPAVDKPIGKIEERVMPGGAYKWALSTRDTGEAFDLLRRTEAQLVYAYPSIMWGVLAHCAEVSQSLPLQLISTVSEVVPDELRELVRQIPGCRLRDTYGCVEGGIIAAQCSLCDAYHPADRHLVLELIADDGRPAQPGEMARVIITPLFNAAMPLVRYETGDYVTLAEGGSCPRSPLAIKRVIGRESELFKLPDGRKIAANLPPTVAYLLGVRKFKLFQTTFSDVELHYIPRVDGTEIAQDVAQNIADRYLSPHFRIHPVRVSEIPRAPSGKYLYHECLV